MTDQTRNKKRKKKKSNVIINIIIIILIAVFAFSAYNLGKILYTYHQGTKEYADINKIAGEISDLDWDAILKNMPNTKAWLYSEGTVIDYPVVQGTDNDYYLTHLANGTYNTKGSLFIDYRDQGIFNDFLTIIYGHRMKDKSMFWSIADYREQSYYDEHKTMLLYTQDKSYKLEIFAALTIPADSELYKISFTTESEKSSYLTKVLKENLIATDVSVSTSDNLVMLSTCTYEYDNARAVVFAKLTEVK